MGLLRIPLALAIVGTICMAVAVFNERRMHRHRQPGVTYSQATFRRDGGWRRADLFTPTGLGYQRNASKYGVTGGLLLLAALVALAVVVP